MREAGKILGDKGESIAKNVYIKRGFKIIEENYFNRTGKRVGEIDFVAIRAGSIHFVEVKTRTSGKFGDPAEAVTFPKRRRLRRAISLFLFESPQLHALVPHIDIVAVQITSFDKTRIKVKIYSDAMVDYH